MKGQEWQTKGKPEPVRSHDFIDRDLGKAIPYGVYDVARNEGWVNVGIDHDTAEFAVESIRRWWWRMGRYAYPHATELLITADAGGKPLMRSLIAGSGIRRTLGERCSKSKPSRSPRACSARADYLAAC